MGGDRGEGGGARDRGDGGCAPDRGRADGTHDRWDAGGPHHAAYTETARRLVDADDDVRAAKVAWTGFLVAGHGDALADLPLADPATDLFVAAAYYDFVVDHLTAAVERATGVALGNPEPAAGPVDFGAVHDRVVAASGDELPDRPPRAADAGVLPADAGVLPADADDPAALRAAGTDRLDGLYESVVPREIRLALGEYVTPRGVAALAVDALDVADPAAATFLDPGCGTGAFLGVCIDRVVAALPDDAAPAAVLETVTRAVRGVDVNPVAVRGAKLRYLLALAPVLDAAGVDEVAVPVALADALALGGDVPAYGADHAPGGDPTVDHLVGNPPWVPWSRLPEAARERWRDRHVDDLDLLPHRGAAARLGHANDDVSVPYVWVCVDRYLRAGGRAAFVLKRGATKGPAGTLLRRLRVGDRPLAVTRVHAFDGLRPFGDQVGTDAAVYAFAADADNAFPVATTVWRRGDAEPDFTSGAALRASLSGERTGLVPVDPDDPASAWVRADAERAALGTCGHDVRHGVKDDAAAVYGLDRERLADVEPDLVYPYLKSRHVRRYGITGHDLRLVPMRRAGEDNEARLRERYPGTYAYLRDHRERLEDRSSSWLDDGPFYAVFGLGEYTWADYKVVWCRLGFRPAFAVVSTRSDPDLGEKPVVPGDHYMFVATDDEREAHMLCALLNSAPYRRSLRTVAGGGKASLTKAVVSELWLPEWPGSEAGGAAGSGGGGAAGNGAGGAAGNGAGGAVGNGAGGAAGNGGGGAAGNGGGGAVGGGAAPSLDAGAAERLATLSMDAHEVVARDGDVAGGGAGGERAGTDGELAALQAEVDGLVEDLLASR